MKKAFLLSAVLALALYASSDNTTGKQVGSQTSKAQTVVDSKLKVSGAKTDIDYIKKEIDSIKLIENPEYKEYSQFFTKANLIQQYIIKFNLNDPAVYANHIDYLKKIYSYNENTKKTLYGGVEKDMKIYYKYIGQNKDEATTAVVGMNLINTDIIDRKINIKPDSDKDKLAIDYYVEKLKYDNVVITDEEIKDYYVQNVENFSDKSFNDAHEEIYGIIFDKKANVVYANKIAELKTKYKDTDPVGEK
jgi:hypothetical protein